MSNGFSNIAYVKLELRKLSNVYELGVHRKVHSVCMKSALRYSKVYLLFSVIRYK